MILKWRGVLSVSCRCWRCKSVTSSFLVSADFSLLLLAGGAWSMMHGDGSKDYVLMLIAARDTPFLNIWTLIFQILTSGLYSQFHTAWLCIVRPQTRFYPTYNCFPLLGYNQHWGVQGRRCWLLWRCRNDDSVLRLIFTTVPSSRSSGSWEGTLNRVHPPGLLVCPAHTRPGGGGLCRYLQSINQAYYGQGL